MLKKIIAAITCSSVMLAILCSSAFALPDRVYEIYKPQIAGDNFGVSYETGEITIPEVAIKVKELPIDWLQSDEMYWCEGDNFWKEVPNGFGYNWADVCYASGDVKVVVDDKEVEFPDAEPFIDINGRTMVPLRFVSEALGAKVWDSKKNAMDAANSRDKMYWNDFGRKLYSAMDDPEGEFVKVPVFIDTGNIELRIWTINNEKYIDYTIGSNKIYPNKFVDEQWEDLETVTLDSIGFLKENRTYIPLRFFSEVLGATVEWDDENRTVVITSSEN